MASASPRTCPFVSGSRNAENATTRTQADRHGPGLAVAPGNWRAQCCGDRIRLALRRRTMTGGERRQGAHGDLTLDEAARARSVALSREGCPIGIGARCAAKVAILPGHADLAHFRVLKEEIRASGRLRHSRRSGIRDPAMKFRTSRQCAAAPGGERLEPVVPGRTDRIPALPKGCGGLQCETSHPKRGARHSPVPPIATVARFGWPRGHQIGTSPDQPPAPRNLSSSFPAAYPTSAKPWEFHSGSALTHPVKRVDHVGLASFHSRILH